MVIKDNENHIKGENTQTCNFHSTCMSHKIHSKTVIRITDYKRSVVLSSQDIGI